MRVEATVRDASLALDCDTQPGAPGMRILATIDPPRTTGAILGSLEHPVRSPPNLRARPDGDLNATAEAWPYEHDADA